MGNIIIVGTAPAGVSAALYTARAGIQTTLIGKGGGALEKAEKIENYYGFPAPVTGSTLIKNGIAQAKRVGAEVITDEVIGLSYEDKLTVRTTGGQYTADCVILATGSSRKAPYIPGRAEFEGRGVSYCAVCDAFFHKEKNIAVLGNGEYALSEVNELLPIVSSVTLVTNGVTPKLAFPSEINIITTKIERIDGDQVLERIVFKDGSDIGVSGLFIAVGAAGSSDLAKKIGAEVKGNTIVVDSRMATNIPGLFAAGDCTGGMLQISKAVYEGAVAGTEAVKYIRKNM